MAGCAAPPPPDAAQLATLGGAVAGLSVGAPGCEATGAAVHLGQGRFLTASHLVDGTHPLLLGCRGGRAWVRLAWQGRGLAAEVESIGMADLEPDLGLRYLGGQDLALLQADVAGGPAARPCTSGPRAGEAVLVVTPRRVQVSRIAGLMAEREAAYGGYAELAARLEPGESGGAVFDLEGRCLLGLVAHRERVGREERTRLVEAGALRRFLAGQDWRLALSPRP